MQVKHFNETHTNCNMDCIVLSTVTTVAPVKISNDCCKTTIPTLVKFESGIKNDNFCYPYTKCVNTV